MRITLLCNAGLLLEQDDQILLIDTPNGNCPPFYEIPDSRWGEIVDEKRIVGLYFTHCHPDHYDPAKVEQFCMNNPHVPVFIPEEGMADGKITMGDFEMEYRLMPHAPILQPPPHVVTWIRTKDESIYLPADAELDPVPHRSFLRGRTANIGIWNAMFLSRPQTRELMHEAACRNYIYHMPLLEDDTMGIWHKCNNNFKRFPQELADITVLDHYPSIIL